MTELVRPWFKRGLGHMVIKGRIPGDPREYPPGSLWVAALLIPRRPCLQEAGEGGGKAMSAKHGCARPWQVLDMYSVR